MTNREMEKMMEHRQPPYDDFEYFNIDEVGHKSLERKAAEILAAQIGREVLPAEVHSEKIGVYGMIEFHYAERRPDGLVDLWRGYRSHSAIRWNQSPELVAENCRAGWDAIARHMGIEPAQMQGSANGCWFRQAGKWITAAKAGRESRGPRPGWIYDGWLYVKAEFA